MIVKVEYEIPDLDYEILSKMFAKSGKTVESVTIDIIHSHGITQFNQWMKDEATSVSEKQSLTSAEILTAVNDYIEKVK